MARPKKQTVEYFPHYVTHKKTMYIIENEFGNDGYAFWFKLLELLGKTDGHSYRYENSSNKMYLLAITRVSEETAENILNMLAELDAINKELWENGVIWSDNFLENVKDVYKKRSSELPKKPVIDNEKPNESEFSERKPLETHQSDEKNPQSKVKERKGKEINNNLCPNSTSSDEIFNNQNSCPEGKSNNTDDDPGEAVDTVTGNSEAYKATCYLIDKIIKNHPKASVPNKDPTNLHMQKWVDEMEKLNRLGPPGATDKGYSWPLIYKIIDWCQDDSFWKTNILSTTKFRAKVITLEAQMNEKTKKPQKTKINRGSERDYSDEFFQDLERKMTGLGKTDDKGG